MRVAPEEFDPAEVGPVDLAKAASAQLLGFVTHRVYGTITGVLLLVLTGLMWHYEVTVPAAPNWVLVSLAATVFAAPSAWFVGTRVGAWLYSSETIVLHEVNPKTGDVRMLQVAPDRFEQMDVFNENGKERDRDFLHRITVNGRVGYEVNRYH